MTPHKPDIRELIFTEYLVTFEVLLWIDKMKTNTTFFPADDFVLAKQNGPPPHRFNHNIARNCNARLTSEKSLVHEAMADPSKLTTQHHSSMWRSSVMISAHSDSVTNRTRPDG